MPQVLDSDECLIGAVAAKSMPIDFLIATITAVLTTGYDCFNSCSLRSRLG